MKIRTENLPAKKMRRRERRKRIRDKERGREQEGVGVGGGGVIKKEKKKRKERIKETGILFWEGKIKESAGPDQFRAREVLSTGKRKR